MEDYEDRYQATHYMMDLPGLDLSNKELQKIVLNFLSELKNCGVKGYRFDAAKHIGLPNDGVDFFKNVRTFVD